MRFNVDSTKSRKQAAWIFWPVVLFLIVLAVSINGISLVPPQQYQRLSQNPFTTRTDIANDNYWQESTLLPIVAFYTHWNDPLTFNALCFFILITAYVFFASLSLHKLGFTPAFVFTTILITNPVTTILFSWLGTPDGLTFLFTIPFLFTNSPFLIFALSILGATNHIVFVIAAFEILILRWAAKDSLKPLHLFAQVAGGIIGYLLVWLFLTVNQIQVLARWDYILLRDWDSWFKLNSTNFPLTILSFFNVQWLILFICSILFFNKDKYFYFATWAFLLFNYAVSFFTLDQTRIFSLLSWGILLQCIFHSYVLDRQDYDNGKTHKRIFLQALTIVGFLSFLTPRYYSWEGNIYLAPFWKTISNIFG